MDHETPTSPTEHVRADQLTPGRVIYPILRTEAETVTRVWRSHGYINVHTNQTGPEACYQWQAHEPIRALATAEGGAA